MSKVVEFFKGVWRKIVELFSDKEVGPVEIPPCSCAKVRRTRKPRKTTTKTRRRSK